MCNEIWSRLAQILQAIERTQLTSKSGGRKNGLRASTLLECNRNEEAGYRKTFSAAIGNLHRASSRSARSYGASDSLECEKRPGVHGPGLGQVPARAQPGHRVQAREGEARCSRVSGRPKNSGSLCASAWQRASRLRSMAWVSSCP